MSHNRKHAAIHVSFHSLLYYTEQMFLQFFIETWVAPLHINVCLRKSPVSNRKNNKSSEPLIGLQSVNFQICSVLKLDLKKLNKFKYLNIETPPTNSHLYSAFHGAQTEPLIADTLLPRWVGSGPTEWPD